MCVEGDGGIIKLIGFRGITTNEILDWCKLSEMVFQVPFLCYDQP